MWLYFENDTTVWDIVKPPATIKLKFDKEKSWIVLTEKRSTARLAGTALPLR